MYELVVLSGSTIYEPPVEGKVVWDTSRKNNPGKLTFNCLMPVPFEMGNAVRFKVDGANVFYGFLFTEKLDKDRVKFTAYDQLRYLKNKDTYVYSGKRADQVVKMIADDFRLKTGALANTGYVIPSRVEDNQTLFDIIGNALDATLMQNRRLFVLFDDFGRISLKEIKDMKVPVVLDDGASENYDLSRSIDAKTYNRIKLFRDNKNTGKREIYIAQSTANQNKWGLLQHYEKVEEKVNAQQKADALLNLHNQVEQKLSVKNVFGDVRVRAGSMVLVNLNGIQQWMLVEKAKHEFSESEHTMDLNLAGGGYIV
ncbi:MAG: hydrolase [Clostridiaceae bacterium]|nr:hydrolase [Clostridiaceae bacterium]